MELDANIEIDLTQIPQGMDVIEGQFHRFYLAKQGHDEWATKAKECVDFAESRQWTEKERKVLEEEGRPALTKNNIGPLLRLMYGLFRQNKYDIKYLPGNDGTGTKEIADAITAAAKQISELNQTAWNDAQVFQDGLQTGRGFWDLRLSFEKNRLGEVCETVQDPFSTFIDPEADTYSPEGWNYFCTTRWMSPTEIFLLYKDKGIRELLSLGGGLPVVSSSYYDQTNQEITPDRFYGLDDFLKNDYIYGANQRISPLDHLNRFRKTVRVIDSQHRVLKRTNFFVDLETGAESVIPDSMDMEKIRRIMQWAQMRNLPLTVSSGLKKQVRWTVTAGDRVLFDQWSPYQDLTIVPFFPYFRRGKTMGMVEDLIDPQREINKRASALLHIVMTTANSGWISEEGSMEEDMERALEEEGARPGIHVKYKQGFNAPQRIQPAATSSALKDLEMTAKNDLKEISGVNDSALGQIDRVQSGRAIQARQQQTMIGAELYFDNFSRSRELKGVKIRDLIQRFYTEPRIIRSRSADALGGEEETVLNLRDAAGEIVNNVTQGRYEVAVDQAPISASFMQAQFQEALELVQQGVPIPPDILVDLSSMPNKQQVKERMREEKAIQDEAMKVQALGGKMSLGIPPDMPTPPVVTDGSPAVVVANPQLSLPLPPVQAPQGMPTDQPQ